MNLSVHHRDADGRPPHDRQEGFQTDTPQTTPDPAPNDASEATDEQLLRSYVDGDKAGFTALIKRHERELFHFLVRFLGNRAAADDVFQETFLQVHLSAAQFDPSRHFRPWLFTIAGNKARDYLRAAARRPTVPLQAAINQVDEDAAAFVDLMQSAAGLPDEPLEKQEIQSQVRQIVAQMPHDLREILLLSYFNKFPYKQISQVLGIPLGTVKSRLHSAVAHFAEKWAEANPRSRSS